MPARIVAKTQTADLEPQRPQLPDGIVLGLSYDEIDDVLEGGPVRPETRAEIFRRYTATARSAPGR